MTVRELIEILKELPQEIPVAWYSDEYPATTPEIALENKTWEHGGETFAFSDPWVSIGASNEGYEVAVIKVSGK